MNLTNCTGWALMGLLSMSCSMPPPAPPDSGTAGGVASAGGSSGGGAANPMEDGGASAGGGAPAGGGTVAGGTATAGGAAGGGDPVVDAGPLQPLGGFAQTPIRFAVPGPSYGALESGSGARYRFFDLDSDRRLDLVITSTSSGNVRLTASGPAWSVQFGVGTSLSTSPSDWAVPQQPLINGGIRQVRADQPRSAWDLLDLTGDGRLDLVITSDPATGLPFDAGTSAAWAVFAAVDGGFSSTSSFFEVPSVATLDGGLWLVSSDRPGRRWAVQEVSGDRWADLLVTADPTTDDVWQTDGGAAWLVCEGAAQGFAGCRLRGVPSAGVVPGFRSATETNVTLRRSWALFDLTGDGRDDLVQACDPQASRPFLDGGQASWRVWPALPTTTGALFGSAIEWAVPRADMAAVASAPPSTFSWSTVDLTGDGLVELVQTSDPATRRLFPGPAWHVYITNTTRTGFEGRPRTWALPPVQRPDVFTALSAGDWAALQVTGDGVVDLVQMRDTGSIFSDGAGFFWQLFPGQ